MDEEIKKLLEENLRLNKEIHEMTAKIRRFVIWQQVMGLIKILLIAIPIILGIIYLPPLLKDVTSTYQGLLNLNPANSINLPEGVEKYLR